MAGLMLVARQYMFWLLPYQGSIDFKQAAILAAGTYFISSALLWPAQSRYQATQKLPLIIATHLDEYVESWEFLAVSDPRQLEAALKQVIVLINACIEGLASARAPNISKAVEVLDFLHAVHTNLVSEIGATILVMHLVESARQVRSTLLEIRALAHGGLTPVLDILSSSLLVVNLCTILAVKAGSGMLAELIVLPSVVYVIVYLHHTVRELSCPLDSSPTVPPAIDLEPLLWLKMRVAKKIVAIGAEGSSGTTANE